MLCVLWSRRKKWQLHSITLRLNLGWRSLMSTFLHAVTSLGRFFFFFLFIIDCLFICFIYFYVSYEFCFYLICLGTKLQRMTSLFMQLCHQFHHMNMGMLLGGTSTLMLCWELCKFPLPSIFFGGGRDLNPRPCIYYALSMLTELSSRERSPCHLCQLYVNIVN